MNPSPKITTSVSCLLTSSVANVGDEHHHHHHHHHQEKVKVESISLTLPHSPSALKPPSSSSSSSPEPTSRSRTRRPPRWRTDGTDHRKSNDDDPAKTTKQKTMQKSLSMGVQPTKATTAAAATATTRGPEGIVKSLSFHVTVSSISSLGSITTDDDSDSDSDRSTAVEFESASLLLLKKFPQQALLLERFEDLPPVTSYRSVRSADRWDMLASEDSLPPSPYRRSFELPKPSTTTKNKLAPSSTSHSCGDIMPQMPRRIEHEA